MIPKNRAKNRSYKSGLAHFDIAYLVVIASRGEL